MTKHERDGEEKSRIASVYRKCRIAKLVKDVEESQAQAPFFQESLLELEKDIAESHVAIQAQLHELAFDLETEITKELQLQGRNLDFQHGSCQGKSRSQISQAITRWNLGFWIWKLVGFLSFALLKYDSCLCQDKEDNFA